MSIQGWFPSYWLVWFLTVQGTLKSLLQHYNSKASILWLSAFFMVQLSHPYMTTGKTIALIRQTFDGKVMSLLFNMLSRSRLIIAFLPRSKHLLISWLQSPSAVILEPKKIKSVCHCFRCFPIYLPWSNGTGCYVLNFFECWFSFFVFVFVVAGNEWVRVRSGGKNPNDAVKCKGFSTEYWSWSCWRSSQGKEQMVKPESNSSKK